MANRKSSRPRKRTRTQTGGAADATARTTRPGVGTGGTRRGPSAQEELLRGVQQVWLAGMGAIARAQKDGPAAFSDAVVEGLRFLDTSRSAAQRVVRDVFTNAQGGLQARVGGARSQAQETLGVLESLFQNGVQRTMRRLGVPTLEEIRRLAERVAELDEDMQRIDARGRSAARAAPARKTRSRRRPAKRASASRD